MQIRKLQTSDTPQILKLVERLPQWFDRRAQEIGIPLDLKHQAGFVALLDNILVGFTTYYVAEGRLIIGWLGVAPEHHRKGIGKKLLEALNEIAKSFDIEEMATYTLGDQVDYPPYASTREFYFRCGFKIYQRSQTDNPSCPEEIKIRRKIY
ncbi:MAG: GNAT family N-acetyltransferase [Planctomycetota bacterium]